MKYLTPVDSMLQTTKQNDREIMSCHSFHIKIVVASCGGRNVIPSCHSVRDLDNSLGVKN